MNGTIPELYSTPAIAVAIPVWIRMTVCATHAKLKRDRAAKKNVGR